MGVVATLSVRVTANLSDLEKQFASLERQFGKVGGQLSTMGSKLTAGLTVPIVTAGAAAVKFAADFEKSTTKLVTLSGVSEQQMRDLRQAVLDLAPTVGIGPRALSDALLVVTSTGFEGATALEILKLSAMSSSIGMGDAKDVARALTAAISAYGIENLSAAQAADILHATVVAGGAEANELAGELGRVVGVASMLGVSFAEVGAFIATYTRLGLSAAEATTGLSGALNTILNPSREARTALAEIGVSADGLRKAVAEQGLGPALAQLLERLHGNADAIGAVFGNVRALAGVMGTAGTQAEGYAKNLKAIENSSGSLNRAFVETKKTVAFMWNEFLGEAETVAITLGMRLLPAMRNIFEAAKPLLHMVVAMVEAFGNLPQPLQTTIIGFAGVLAAIGPITFAVGKLISAFGALMTGARLAAGGLGTLSTVGTSAGAAIGTATLPILGFTAAIAGLVFALPKAIDSLTNLWNIWSKFGTKALLGELGRNVKDDNLSFFKNWRVDQQRPTMPGPRIAPIPSHGPGATTPTPTGGEPPNPGGLSKAEWDRLFGSGGTGTKREDPLKSLREQLSGTEAIGAAKSWLAVVKDIGGVTKLTADEQRQFNTVLSDAITKLRALGQVVPRDMAKGWWDSLPKPEVLKDLNNLLDENKKFLTGATGVDPFAQSWLPKIGVTTGLGGLTFGEPIPIGPPLLDPWRDAFTNLGKELPGLLFGALTSGGNIIGNIAASVGAQFSQFFNGALDKVGGDLSQLGSGTQWLGMAGAGIGTAIAGFQMGQRFGKGKGALAGAASGALAGTMVMPGIGTAIGAGIGAIAGWFGGRSKEKKDRQAMEEMQQQLLDQFGGMENLRKAADAVGVSIGNAFNTDKPAEFQAFVDKLNAGLDAQKKRLEGIGMIIEGVNARVAVFADKIDAFNKDLADRNIDPKSQQATDLRNQFGATNQEEFNRLGTMAVGAVALQVKETGSLIGALNALAPTLKTLTTAQTDFNFTASETVTRLLGINAAVEANRPAFQALEADGQIVRGMLQGNLKDFELFKAVAADIGAQINAVVANGVPMAQALALAQPQLQALWEAQKKYGFAVDESTQALLTQAEQQGLVGDQMKSVNEKILDVLLAIGKVLGADIPDALLGLPSAAQVAADGIQNAFNGITYDGITYPLPNADDSSFNVGQPRPDYWEVPELASGGVVTRPTMAIVGEAGPEAVVPLDDYFHGGSMTLIQELDGRTIAEATVPYIPGEVQRLGLA